MNVGIGSADIAEVYATLEQTTIGFHSAQVSHVDAKEKLERRIAHALLAGEISGKNEMERNAAARIAFDESYEELEELARNAREAELALKLAQLQQSRIWALIRLLEVEVAHFRHELT